MNARPRASARSLFALTLGCATIFSVGCATRASGSGECAESSAVVLPSWASGGEVGVGPTARVLAEALPPRETVRLAPEAERDPVDELLRSQRGGRRLQAMALREAPVTDTLRLFAELAGVNVVFADDVQDRRVTLSLRGVSVAAAFRTVLRAAHLGAEVVGGEILEVRPANRQAALAAP